MIRKVKQKINKLKYPNYNPKIIAVSKTFGMEDILPLIEFGHEHFGENKSSSSFTKWKEIKTNKNNIKLHMIGSCNQNKVKQAVVIFDYIHSIDSIKLAQKLLRNK